MIQCTWENGVCALHGSLWPCTTKQVLEDVRVERSFQYQKYGDNRENEWGNGPETRWLQPFSHQSAVVIEEGFREDYDQWEEQGAEPTWVHLVREEVAEAFRAETPEELERELIQVAALAVSWVEKIRESRQWGVSTLEGTIVCDLEWHSANDVLRGSHYHGVDRVRVYSRFPGEEWKEYTG